MYGRFAGIYDSLMSDVNYDEWAGYIAGFLPDGVLRIADCACGTGEITLRLAKMGHMLTGVDISEDMLRVASDKARRAALKIPFVCEDMRKLALHRPADAVVCACDGVNYLDSARDAGAFFAAAHAALKPNGLLLFDVSSEYKLQNVLCCNTFAFDDGREAYIWKNCYDPQTRLIRMELSFFAKKGELYERFEEVHIQRAHRQEELMRLLEAAGFEACAYEAFTRKPVGPKSERIQFAARKL